MTQRPPANPFNNGIVPDAWVQPVVDVASIHGDVSELCLQLLDEVARQRKRRSILIRGAAGSGKTHTLSRLRAAATAGTIIPAPAFAYVRLTTSPNMIRRHLRQCLTRDLVRKDATGVPLLESLVLDALAKEAGVPPARAELERFCETPGQCDALRTAFDEMCSRLGIDCHVACALRLFLQRRHRHAVVHWLESGALPDDVREQLSCDLGAADETVDPEHVAFSVTLQLIAMATDTRPVVLCFDQLEAMQVAADDEAGYFAVGKLAADLFDHCQSLLLITCVQTAAMPLLTRAIPAHDLHRLAQHERTLVPLTHLQARDLIRARLDSSPTLRGDPRRRHDPLWPIDEETFRRFLAADPTPRRLCALGRDAFAVAHRMPPEINDYLSAAFEQRRGEPLESVGTDGGFVHGLAVLLAAGGAGVSAPDDREDVDLVLDLPERRVLISVCNDEGGTLTHRLKQILDRPPTGTEERVVIRDARRPIPLTSKKAWEHWHELAADAAVTAAGIPRVRTVSPTTEVIASLEAVRSLVSDARSGDLEAHGETVPPEVVAGWVRQHLRDDGLRALLAEIGHEAGTAAASPGASHGRLRDAALEILQRRHVMLIDDLAVAAHCPTEEMRLILAADAATFGTLGIPPILAFDRSIPVP